MELDLQIKVCRTLFQGWKNPAVTWKTFDLESRKYSQIVYDIIYLTFRFLFILWQCSSMDKSSPPPSE